MMKAGILLLATLLFPITALHAEAAKRPNIILILADDLGYGSLGCYGNAEVKTPNIDQLAASGVRFTDFHSNGAMCSPTRAALMTGRYPQRCVWIPDEELSPVFREQRNENPAQRWAWGISPDEVTIPRLLKQAGYRSSLIGKWHLGYNFRFHPMNHGFDEFRGFVGGNVDYHTHVASHGMKELDWWNDRKIENENGYTTDLLTKHAVDFIARNRTAPFFLYLAHATPHAPWQGREPGMSKSPVETYKEMIRTLDESVGAVINAVRANDLEKNTLVIFNSDNGPAAPGGFAANGVLRGKKGGMFEGGHRVPFIASWPGVIPAGATSNTPAMTMDLLPTFTMLAGVAQNNPLDGIDLMPLLTGPAKKNDRVLHWLFGNSWAVRKGAWKLMGKGNNAQTLVNLEKDLPEKDNHLKDMPGLVEELTKLHREWIESAGDR